MADDLFGAGGPGQGTSDDDRSPYRSIDEIPEAGGAEPNGSTAAGKPRRLDLVLNIPVRLSVELGRAEIPIGEVVDIGHGSVIELDRTLGEPLDVRVNGVLIGHGEIVVFDEERLGLRFVDVVSQAERVDRLI